MEPDKQGTHNTRNYELWLKHVLGHHFSPDGKTIAIASDSSVILENFDLEQLGAIACDWLKDYLEYNPQGQQSLYRDCKAMNRVNSMRSHYTDEQPSDRAS